MEIRGNERREHLGTGRGFHPCEGRDHRREIEHVGEEQKTQSEGPIAIRKKRVLSETVRNSQKQSWKEVHYERPDGLLTE